MPSSMNIRSVCMADLRLQDIVLLPVPGDRHGRVEQHVVRSLAIEGNDDVVINGTITSSMSNLVSVADIWTD